MDMDFFGPCAERRQCAQDDDGGTECQGGEKADIDFAPDSLFSEKCRQRRVFAEGCTGEKFVAHEAERVAEPPPDYGTYEEGEEQACRCDDRLAQRASVEDECHWNDENKGECRCVEHREQADAEGRFEDMLELIGAFEGGYHLRAAEYQQ